jgi:FlaA1/EpsC-like NDP-sugar epimerase
MKLLNLLRRNEGIFKSDIEANKKILEDSVSGSNFLVLGGAGSIGQAVTKEIFKRKPKILHVIDISENNLVELVRDLRSSLGYIEGEFKTFCFDIGSKYFIKFIEQQSVNYDYVLNLSALKHVRSEKVFYCFN